MFIFFHRAFGLETSSGCVNDYVTVKENDNQGQELARYCGDGIPINMTVAHNMYVQFISNSAISGPGFMAQFNSCKYVCVFAYMYITKT